MRILTALFVALLWCPLSSGADTIEQKTALANLPSALNLKVFDVLKDFDFEAAERELGGFLIINSPIMIGGQYGLTLNWRWIFKGNITKAAYVEMLIAADEDISALNNDDRPSKTYEADLRKLKLEKALEYSDKFDRLAQKFLEYKAARKGAGLKKKILEQLRGLNPL